MRQLLLFIVLLLSASAVRAQQGAAVQQHLIYFTDKEGSPFSISQPLAFLSPKALERRQHQRIQLTHRDLPVNPAYVTGLKQQGVEVRYTSRWFNAALVQCNDAELAQLANLPFVKRTYTLHRETPRTQLQAVTRQEEKMALTLQAPAPVSAEAYGAAFHQANMLGAVELHQAGFRGEGMTIAVLDAGFPGVDTIAAFSHLFQDQQLKGTYDFVQKDSHVFGANAHGTAVLSTIAAYAPGKMIGTAYAANFLLLRTEDAATEHHIEEINWLLAAEYADSAGADVISSSLGYTVFDAPAASYTYSDMDGNTALVSKAADMAAATGMLVVVSAGNEGSSSWHYISAPADADSVLTVGAVDSLGAKAAFSSFGPTADGRTKPDVVALGAKAYVLNTAGQVRQGSGTSFAGPIMAGFATCLWQVRPAITNYRLIQLLHELGSNAASPDSAIGYGIPTYAHLITALPELNSLGTAAITNPVLQDEIVLSLGTAWGQQPVVLHVYDTTGKIVHQEQLEPNRSRHELRLQGSQLKRGVYICRLQSAKQSATLRFVKL
ncbi:S8 family serine peptidase [Pontibacter chitinilyticus]|uniref:S8 family serine peptidase n=1 Tax=Pontibacter chitinilyticus TaxID=2674989 RepID=UPI00321BB214